MVETYLESTILSQRMFYPAVYICWLLLLLALITVNCNYDIFIVAMERNVDIYGPD